MQRESRSGDERLEPSAQGVEPLPRFHRVWSDESGAEWSARVDRMALSCGACDLTRYLHVFTPADERWTFTLAPDADLSDVPDAALERMVKQRAARSREAAPDTREPGRAANQIADT